jgi:crotonobetainyl-CoA:carnitine CoA-transferase CaiB-like acyl-CoA transferase
MMKPDQLHYEDSTRPGMLGPYRVLDLTNEQGLLCGKILGDLGADVIKIERPVGDPARAVGPFYHDDPHPERSLFWFAMNTSKRGVTLNIESEDGQEIFRKLVATTDFVVESFAPGYLDTLGIGFAQLARVNPEVILISITPFGQSGPHRDYQSSDIVAWAMGGEMAPHGDADRPPIRFSHHSQAYLHAGTDGAQGALTALYQRWITGAGQHIDVSIQESVVQCLEHITSNWDLRQAVPDRAEEIRSAASHRTRQLWPCKDGWVSWSHGGGSLLAPSLPLIRWMKDEGFRNNFVDAFDWSRPDFSKISQAEMDQIDEPTARFFMAHTKAELLEGAVSNNIMMYPVSTTADIMSNRQLAARGFWEEVEHPELGTTITYPGAFVHSSESAPRIWRRAPLIGEHNSEIYTGELGIATEQLVTLTEAGVI